MDFFYCKRFPHSSFAVTNFCTLFYLRQNIKWYVGSFKAALMPEHTTCPQKFFLNQPPMNDNRTQSFGRWCAVQQFFICDFSTLNTLKNSVKIIMLIPLGTDRWLLGSTSFCWVSFWEKQPQNTQKVPFPATQWAAAPVCDSWGPCEGWTVV